MKGKLRNLSFALALLAFTAPAFLRADTGTGTKNDLSAKVRHQILSQPYYTIFDTLGYKVDGGTVTLYGEVTWPVLKTDVEHAVKKIEGVEKVVDNIKVLPLSPMDNGIRRAEYRAIFGFGPLYRYAIGANPSIHIIVDNGHVTLVGFVDNEADKNMAYVRANGVPGVFSVTNDLQVAGRG